MIKLYFIGLGILVTAIIANAIVVKIGIKSWYYFINLLAEHQMTAFSKIGILDYIWLFIGYPLVLALGYLAGSKLYHLIFN
ncbi:hypothetical protein FJ651_00510 [Paucihalobacter ruber]|uniref:Uncharacterized protein n=1 Tax=Paucihalobacter ruber TaxID=2567861 RepID=A0A506PNG5_9FLAO|nr:hypothetical protein [Paucihalobacter ruber]TPV35436.1 hypothetical protein FJ651_00510 [Paucihalobacter ruber]